MIHCITHFVLSAAALKVSRGHTSIESFIPLILKSRRYMYLASCDATQSKVAIRKQDAASNGKRRR